jgi:hypothetical protein
MPTAGTAFAEDTAIPGDNSATAINPPAMIRGFMGETVNH